MPASKATRDVMIVRGGIAGAASATSAARAALDVLPFKASRANSGRTPSLLANLPDQGGHNVPRVPGSSEILTTETVALALVVAGQFVPRRE